MSVYKSLMDRLSSQKANYLVLIDPDAKNDDRLEAVVRAVNTTGVDALLVGGSLIMDGGFERRLETIKSAAEVPVILFPGASNQLSGHADAILFMSLLSGRNPQYLIGEQVQAAPVVRQLGLETIPTGYLLLAGGRPTAVEFMSNSQPLPMDQPDLALAHALAAQYLGMSLVYLEAGSGAKQAVTNEIVQVVSGEVDIPVLVGGGICTPDEAAAKVKAGAKFVVTGSVWEDNGDLAPMRAFADAVHGG